MCTSHGTSYILCTWLIVIRHYSSLRRSNGVPWQVERIAISSEMPYSHSASLVLRAPPPVTVAFARSRPAPTHTPSPLPGRSVGLRTGRWAARAQPRWVLCALSKAPCGGSRAENHFCFLSLFNLSGSLERARLSAALGSTRSQPSPGLRGHLFDSRSCRFVVPGLVG